LAKTVDGDLYESSSILYDLSGTGAGTLPAYLRYYQPGVGGPTDLETRLESVGAGEYAPALKEGWYHLARRSRYLFGSRAKKTITASATGLQTAELGFDILEHSDVICAYEYSQEPPYAVADEWLRVSCPIRAYVQTPQSGWVSTGTGLWYYEVPESGFILEVYRGSWNQLLSQVPSSGLIMNSGQYAYEELTSRLFCAGDSQPSDIYITYAATSDDANLLPQTELLVVDRDGVVRTQYSNLYTGTDIYRPRVTRLIDGSTTTVYPTGVSSNELSFAASGAPAVGERVAATYFVRDSFSVRYSGTTVDWFVESAPAALRLEFSGTSDDELRTAALMRRLSELVLLEPLKDGSRRGFIYMRPGDDAPLEEEKAAELEVVLDRAKAYLANYNSKTAVEPAALMIRARTSAGWPAAGIPVAISVQNGVCVPACDASKINPPVWVEPSMGYRRLFTLTSDTVVPAGTTVALTLTGESHRHFYSCSYGLYHGLDARLFWKSADNVAELDCHVRACSRSVGSVEVAFKLPAEVNSTTPLTGLWLYYGGPARVGGLADLDIYIFADDFLYYMPGENTHLAVYEAYPTGSTTTVLGDPVPCLLFDREYSGVRKSLSGVSNSLSVRAFTRCMLIDKPAAGYLVVSAFYSAGTMTDALGISSAGVLHYWSAETSSWAPVGGGVALCPGIEYGLELVVDRATAGARRNLIYVDGVSYEASRGAYADAPAYWAAHTPAGSGHGSFKIRELALWDYTSYSYESSVVASADERWSYITNRSGELRFLIIPSSTGTVSVTASVLSGYAVEEIVGQASFECLDFSARRQTIGKSGRKLLLAYDGAYLTGQVVRLDGVPALELSDADGPKQAVTFRSKLGALAGGAKAQDVSLGEEAAAVVSCDSIPGDEVYAEALLSIGESTVQIRSQRLKTDAVN